MKASPYRFLNYYREEDKDDFFGREREIQILLSDVIINRLVVLFAKTGTGKTSLINAGVIPLLRDREYEPFFIRVRKDPIESARDVLIKHPKLRGMGGETLCDLLGEARRLLSGPIVLFFDQFEEFFIYYLKERATAKQARQFISDVAEIYKDRSRGIHFIFSMREEWFVEMDHFRDEIPTIFHNDSNLRLRPFDARQAGVAILCPARKAGVNIEWRLLLSLIRDLSRDKEIEPAQLQIVMDTLWEDEEGGLLRYRDYIKYKREEDDTSAVIQIINRSLEKEFYEIEKEEHLKLLEKLLPMLRTKQNTKYVRDVSGLVREIERELEAAGVFIKELSVQINELIERLVASRLINKVDRDDQAFIELTHDYLADQDRLTHLIERVRLILPRRLIAEAVSKYEQNGEPMLPEYLVKVSEKLGEMSIDRRQAEVLFRSSLAHGLEVELWYGYCSRRGVDVWRILREKIEKNDIVESTTTINLLGKLGTDEAVKLLAEAIEKDQLASSALEALSYIETIPAIELAAKALGKKELSSQAQEALLRITKSRDTQIAMRAVAASFDFLERLSKRGELDLQSQDILVEMAKSRHDDVVSQTRKMLETMLDHPKSASPGLDVLSRVETTWAVDLASGALKREALSTQAADVLLRLSRARRTEVATLAQEALLSFSESKQLVRPPRISEDFADSAATPSPNVSETYIPSTVRAPMALIRNRLKSGRIIPFLGPGAYLSGRAPDQVWKDNTASFLPSTFELAQYLAQQAAFPSTEVPVLSEVAQYYQIIAGRQMLVDELHSIFDGDYPPTSLHTFLASIPSPLLIVNTCYDDLTERAFKAIHRHMIWWFIQLTHRSATCCCGGLMGKTVRGRSAQTVWTLTWERRR